jgi:hypothetical protein
VYQVDTFAGCVSDCMQGLDGFGGHIFADAVAGNHRDTHIRQLTVADFQFKGAGTLRGSTETRNLS